MKLLLGALVVGLGSAGLRAFACWRRRLLARLVRGSEIRETAKGPVEFVTLGTGPVLLQLHGGASGYDQSLALTWDLHRAGFTVLTPSRPGYLRTPLEAGAAPEQAADAMASLLDGLGISRVCVIGTSGGGPTALQFALRHPERAWGLVLHSAISRRFLEPRHFIWVGPGAEGAREKISAFLSRHAPEARPNLDSRGSKPQRAEP